MELDRISFDIIAALQNDGRLSNKELAARLGLAPSSCSVRVRQLREAGVLRGAHEQVDPKALGIGLQAMIAVQLGQHAREAFAEFAAHAIALREVIAVYRMAGANDFLIHVAVRDAEHLREVVTDQFTTRREVQHMETALIFDHQRTGALPIYSADPRPA